MSMMSYMTPPTGPSLVAGRPQHAQPPQMHQATPSASYQEWLKAWKSWAGTRKRGKMAQFIVQKLEENVSIKHIFCGIMLYVRICSMVMSHLKNFSC